MVQKKLKAIFFYPKVWQPAFAAYLALAGNL